MLNNIKYEFIFFLFFSKKKAYQTDPFSKVNGEDKLSTFCMNDFFLLLLIFFLSSFFDTKKKKYFPESLPSFYFFLSHYSILVITQHEDVTQNTLLLGKKTASLDDKYTEKHRFTFLLHL